MSHQDKTKSVIDYSKWDDVVVDDDFHVDVQTAFNPANIQQQPKHINIPRSPRPLPSEAPVLASAFSASLLEAPPFNAPKGAAAVRHYQVGFGHNIINKNKNKNKAKHRKAASMSVFDEMQQFLANEESQNVLTNHNANDGKRKEKKYGIKIEDDNSELLKECGELLQFMMQENENEMNNNNGTETRFGPKHNPYEYYRQKAMKTHDNSDELKDIPKVDVVVKIGGAFITNKNKIHTLRQDNIDIAAKHICDAFNANYRMILVHGAGSYGHFEAKQYKLMNGLYANEATARQGMVLCRAAVSVLHQHLLAKLIEYRLPVMSVSPCNIITSNDGIISRKQLRGFICHIRRIIKYGMVPLIHGDIIFDDRRGCHILSGDKIVENLCSVFNPQRAVFWSNINGVYDCRHREHKLIQSINVNPQGKAQLDGDIIKQLKHPNEFFKKQKEELQDEYMQELSKKFDAKLKNKEKEKENENVDVDVENINAEKVKGLDIDATGGMWAKIEVAARCCAQGIDVVITKGGSNDAKLALLGKYVENATVFVPVGTLM